jgi:hypothetical protein
MSYAIQVHGLRCFFNYNSILINFQCDSCGEEEETKE